MLAKLNPALVLRHCLRCPKEMVRPHTCHIVALSKLSHTKYRAKEFEDQPKASQQISHLKKILADLGMTGRLSIEKAKEIRERRELAAEIGMYIVV